ncbi:hypothetical protein [Bradyrhizobium liaoningense]|uniref:hypothetical protein n=1 Tax=Bradyrhizobium liaoningense TaxID=43992 RepID=UPI001BAC9BC2|nr:hypothetical protein [Bradyrhizobium liaoningense]MBR0944363.1 hypothetical protein [Bradyrhizobium liaoningense]
MRTNRPQALAEKFALGHRGIGAPSDRGRLSAKGATTKCETFDDWVCETRLAVPS